MEHITETLFELTPAGKIQPRLALSQSVSADGRTWTIRLRTGVRFHDGTPFDAEAAKFNLDRVLNPATRASFRFLIDRVTSVTVVDPSTIGLPQVMVAVGIVSIPTYARLVRGQVLAMRSQEFVDAARALGATSSRIIWRHVLPNTLAVIIVQSTLQFASAILSAAALGFLGLGAQPPAAEWGSMLSNARQYIRLAPHSVTFPGIAIMLTVLGFNLLGDAVRDALDPRMRV